MLGAFITAIVFVITMSLSLPKTDEAYGRVPFADPLRIPTAPDTYSDLSRTPVPILVGH
jgi:hypothetical protein